MWKNEAGVSEYGIVLDVKKKLAVIVKSSGLIGIDYSIRKGQIPTSNISEVGVNQIPPSINLILDGAEVASGG